MAKVDVIRARDEVAVYCAVCGGVVPPERVAQGAITCSKEHGAKRANFLRARKEARECKYCHKPSTPEDREAFLRFKKLARKRPDVLYPAEFDAWVEQASEGQLITPEAFAKWWNEKEPEPVAETEPESEPETESTRAEIAPVAADESRRVYVLVQDIFGRKGYPCEILKVPGVGNGLTQIRFSDGFSPIVQRASIRAAKPSELKLLDEMIAAESTLAASGKTHAGE